MKSLQLLLWIASGLAVTFSAGVWTGSRYPEIGNSVLPGFSYTSKDGGSRGPGNIQQSPRTAAGGLGGQRGKELAGLSPAAAWNALAAYADSSSRRRAALRHFKSLPPQQWESWMEEVLGEASGSIGDDPARNAIYYGVVNDLLEAIITVGAAEFLSAVGMDSPRGDVVAEKWAKRDPAAARAWIQKLLNESADPPEGSGRLAARIAGVVARNNPSEALGWALELPEAAGTRSTAVMTIVSELADINPEEAAGAFTLHAEKFSNAGPIARKIAAALAADNPQTALRWASVVTMELRRDAVAGALSKWAERDFNSALSAVKGLEDGTAPYGLAAVIGVTPAARLPEVAWLLETQPESEGRAAAGRELMRVWTDQDPEEASAWMKRQPMGAIRDEAIKSFVQWASTNDPEAAFLWAGSVSDPETRVQTVDHLVRRLKEPEALEAWMASNPSLPAEEMQRLRKQAAELR